VGMAGVGHQLVRMGCQSIRIVSASVCVIFILLQKIQKTGAPTCLCKQELGKLRWNAAKVQDCVNDDLRADGLWKGWGFWVGT